MEHHKGVRSFHIEPIDKLMFLALDRSHQAAMVCFPQWNYKQKLISSCSTYHHHIHSRRCLGDVKRRTLQLFFFRFLVYSVLLENLISKPTCRHAVATHLCIALNVRPRITGMKWIYFFYYAVAGAVEPGTWSAEQYHKHRECSER